MRPSMLMKVVGIMDQDIALIQRKHEEGSIRCLFSLKLKDIPMYELQFDRNIIINISYDAIDIDVKVVVD
jgi:hypothetical protein